MIVYNVTVKVETSLVSEWMDWMKTTHIQEVLNTECFQSAQMFHLVEHDDEEGKTFSIQYKCGNFELLQKYQSDFAPSLQKIVSDKYGDKVLAFRTILKEV